MSDTSVMSSQDPSDRCRTVVVSGVPEVLSSVRMNDKLTIHFQSTRNHGGDIEQLEHPTHKCTGVPSSTFGMNWSAVCDLELILLLAECCKSLTEIFPTSRNSPIQFLEKELEEEYLLTVYKFTPEGDTLHMGQGRLSRLALLAIERTLVKSLEKTPCWPKLSFPSLKDQHPPLLYTYIQMLDKEEWDRCVSRYNVTTEAVSTGEVTRGQLSSKCGLSVLNSAKTILKNLVAERQDTLRTQIIDYSSTDPGAKKQLLQACECVQKIHKDVCYIPTVIGPSISSHFFCEKVKIYSESAWV